MPAVTISLRDGIEPAGKVARHIADATQAPEEFRSGCFTIALKEPHKIVNGSCH